MNQARQLAPTARVFMKSAHLEWSQGNIPATLELLNEGIEKFKDFTKFYMMKGQIALQNNQIDEAKAAFNIGLKISPNCLPLWLLLSRVEESCGFVDRARSILERAKIRITDSDILW